MEIKSDSFLFALLAVCSLPLIFTALITIAVLSTRSRLREAKRWKKDLQENPAKGYSGDKKSFLKFRIAAGCLSIFWIGLSIGFLLFMYGAFIGTQIDNRILLLVAVLFLSSFVAGILMVFFAYKRNKLNK